MCDVDEQKSQSLYHFAMNGKSFGVIEEHFPDMLQKVPLHYARTYKFTCCCSSIYAHFFFFFPCLLARVARHRFCQNGPGPENPTCGDAAGSGVSPDSQDCSNKLMTVFVSVRICTSFKVGSNSLHRLMTFSQLLCGYVWRRSKRLWGTFHQL